MIDERPFFVPPELGGDPARMFEHAIALSKHGALDEKLRLDPALSVETKIDNKVSVSKQGFFARLFSRSSAAEPAQAVPKVAKTALPDSRQIFTPPPGSTGPW